MSIRFIHAADLHIDSLMKGLSSKNSDVAAEMQKASYDAFHEMISYAIQERVSFIVIAGDVFDGKWGDAGTGKKVSQEFRRLEAAQIPVYLVYGNHDAKNKIIMNMMSGSGCVFPSNVRIFSSERPERFYFIDKESKERVAITGQSYSDEKCEQDLAQGYPEHESDAFNIAVLHTGLEGTGNYAPTSVLELKAKGYQYWALGHQHSRETLCCEPNLWIGYSGVLQARHINEGSNADGSNKKGFFLVEVNEGRRVGAPKFVPVDSFRWAQIEINLEDVETSDPETALVDVEEILREKLQEEVDKADGCKVAVRVRLSGRSVLYHAFRDAEKGGKDKDSDPRAVLEQSHNNINVWIEGIDSRGVKPIVPEDFWRRPTFCEIHNEVSKICGELDQTSPDDRKRPAIDELRNWLRKNIPGIDKELLCGWNPGGGAEQAPDDDGFKFDDAETLKRWYQESLDILADAFASTGDDKE